MSLSTGISYGFLPIHDEDVPVMSNLTLGQLQGVHNMLCAANMDGF